MNIVCRECGRYMEEQETMTGFKYHECVVCGAEVYVE